MRLTMGTGVLVFGWMCVGAGPASAQDGAARGAQTEIDASFNYQGRLEVDGAPANGDFFFEVNLLGSDGDLIDPRFATPGPITVVDGVFDMDILMGGTDADADFFWRTYGHLAKKARIGVGTIEGVYTELSPDVDLGSSPHALYSRYAGAIRFPYTDTYTDINADPVTMFSLTNEFGGVVAEFRSNEETDEPVVYIRGENVYSPNFNFQSGALLVDSMDDEVAIRGEGSRLSVIGFHSDPFTLPGVGAAVLGSIGFNASPELIAVWANNSAAQTSARLGTELYAGDFDGDVLARDDLRVVGVAERDFAPNMPAPIGPIAYGFINGDGIVIGGTANLNCFWDPALNLYRVSVDGVSFVFGAQSVQVTVIDLNEPRVATTNMVSGEIRVAIWDLNSGNALVQDNFQIAIFDPTAGSAIAIDQTPPGVDPDKYSEQTGISPVRVIQNAPRPVEPVPAAPRLDAGSSD